MTGEVALVWLDLETTGLDPCLDQIVELGIVLTDAALNEVARQSWVVYVSPWTWVHRVDPYVFAMHNFSGLRTESMTDGLWIDQVEQLALGWLARFGVTADKKLPLAGNTIGFDRGFMQADMPDLWATFSHRSLDVSSFTIAAQLWAPGLAESRPGADGHKAHRALADIDNSIAQMRHYAPALVDGWLEYSGPWAKEPS